MIRKSITFIIALIILLTLTSCSKDYIKITDRTFALDTLTEIKIYYYETNNNDVNQDLIKESFNIIRQLEETLSVHIDGSDIYNLNLNAGKSPTKVSDITYNVVLDSIEFSEITNGLFDITSGPLIDLWAIDPPEGHVPTASELDYVIPLINFKDIEFINYSQLFLKDKDMVVNLGAIAKGSIADEVKKYLKSQGVEHCLINLGGNILLIGSKPDGKDFSVGVQDPNDARGAYLMSIELADIAVVSSGDYERFFEQDGKIYHHILNTKTGYPAETNIKQVSIIAPNSQIADGLSTSVLLMGLEDGINLIESKEEVDAIFVTKDNKIYFTDGFDYDVTYSDEQMKGYTVVTELD